MTLTADEQELLDFGVGALPDWVSPSDPILTAAAKPMGAARAIGDYLFKQALITTADGPTATTPDWLNQHARDRGTSRQLGESDAALAARLRVIPDALTRPAILAAANAVLSAAGVSGQAALLEMPRDGAWIGRYFTIQQSDPGGGVFAHLGSAMTFTPATPFMRGIQQIWTPPSVFPGTRYRLQIQFANDSGNNGTFEIIGLVGNAMVYANPSGVDRAADTAAVSVITRLDATGNPTDGPTTYVGGSPVSGGFARSFCNRGWRVVQARPFELRLILPFGTSAGTAASVAESIRLKKAAGYVVAIEVRQHP